MNMNYTQATFRTTYVFMCFACILSLTTSFYVKSDQMRQILLLECLITGFAAYIYSFYNKEIDEKGLTHESPSGWRGINRLRYIDWSFTTPLMLISLSLFLSMKSGIKIDPLEMFLIVLLDWAMLYFGYLGENNRLKKWLADILGFIPFAGIFWLLCNRFLRNMSIPFNNCLFAFYFVLWFSYGVLYMSKEKIMNTYFNVLDCIAKAFVAIFISCHFLYGA